jgi:hypothetical protein
MCILPPPVLAGVLRQATDAAPPTTLAATRAACCSPAAAAPGPATRVDRHPSDAAAGLRRPAPWPRAAG